MNKGITYNDLNVLTKWIDNQRAFERHKKKLDDIYSKLHKNSVDEFGIRHKTFEVLQNRIKTIYEIHKFNNKEKNTQIDKFNQILNEKISNIQKRENLLVKNQIDTNGKNKVLRKRIGILKSMEMDKIKKQNEQLAKRIVERSPCVSMKKYDDEYQKTLYYKRFNHKFELPKIQAAGIAVVGRKLDIAQYQRKPFRSNSSSFDMKRSDDNLASSMKNLKTKTSSDMKLFLTEKDEENQETTNKDI